MKIYLLRRALAVIPVMVIVATVAFVLIHLAPGDPASVIAGPYAAPEDVAKLRGQLGLDRAAARPARALVRAASHGRSRQLDLPAPPSRRGRPRAARAHLAPHGVGHADRRDHRRARRHHLRPLPQLRVGPVAHGAGPRRAVHSQLSPRAPDDPRLRRLARLAARGGLRAARRGRLAQRAIAPHAERLARPRAVRPDRAHHPLQHARRVARAVHHLRPRQGPRRAHRGLQARAEERDHPDLDGDRNHLRHPHRGRRRHRDRLQYPGAGPARSSRPCCAATTR